MPNKTEAGFLYPNFTVEIIAVVDKSVSHSTSFFFPLIKNKPQSCHYPDTVYILIVAVILLCMYPCCWTLSSKETERSNDLLFEYKEMLH